MTPTTKTIWQSHENKKPKPFLGREAQIRHFRRSELTKDAIKRILRCTKLARKRYSGRFGDGPWDATKKPFIAAAKRLKVADRRRRRRDKASIAVFKEIHKAQHEASRRTHAQSIACFGRVEGDYRKEKVTALKRPSGAMTNSETIPIGRGAVNALLPKCPTGVEMPQNSRSVSHMRTTTKRTAHSDDRLRTRSHPGGPGARTEKILDLAPASNSQDRHKSLPLQSGSAAIVIPIQRLPSWAHWYEPPLSTAQVAHVRERMKLQEEYMRIRPSQRQQVLVDDLSAALRSMCQTFNRSYKVHIGMFPGVLWAELSRPRGKAMSASKNSDSSSLSKRPIHADHPNHKKRKTSGRSHGQFQSGHHGAHLPRQDLSYAPIAPQNTGQRLQKDLSEERTTSNDPERRRKDLSIPSWSSHTRTTDKKELASSYQIRTTAIPGSTPDRHEDAELNVETEKLVVNIPADTDMATDVRAYSQWPDDSRALKNAHGCLLPAGYRFSRLPGFDWICPMRTCRRCFQSQSGLGCHFSVSHYSCLLNDNRDGTFTILGKYEKNQNGDPRPPIVQSKNALPKNAPPIMGPRPPATANAQQKKLFTAIQKKARSRAAPDSTEEKTVDEMMLDSNWDALSEAGISVSSDPKGFPRTPSSRNSKKCLSKPGARSSNASRLPARANAGDGSTGHMLGSGIDRNTETSHMHSPSKQSKAHVAPEPREQASLGTSSQITEVDNRFTFSVHVVPLDGSLDLNASPLSVRLCSLTSGKALVEVDGNSPFLIGPHGMFNLMPATTARLSNASEAVAVVHVSTIKS